MTSQPVSRRDELLELAATMFAERGLRATTVRDIAKRCASCTSSIALPGGRTSSMMSFLSAS